MILLQFLKRRKRPYSWIEPKIKPLVDAMNATGVMKTIASCEGHYFRDMSPYVYFKAPVALAAALERTLRPERGKPADPRLHHFWTLEGHFNGEYELCFSIRAPKLDRSMPLRRKRIDQDILVLAEIIIEIVEVVKRATKDTMLIYEAANSVKLTNKKDGNNYEQYNGKNTIPFIFPSFLPFWVKASTKWTLFRLWRQVTSTIVARYQGWHITPHKS